MSESEKDIQMPSLIRAFEQTHPFKIDRCCVGKGLLDEELKIAQQLRDREDPHADIKAAVACMIG